MRWIGEEPGLEVVARHAHRGLAVEDVARSAPDIVVLDIEMPVMPVMDGLEALPLLLRAKPWVRVLMASTLTKRNAEISFRVLSLGALDYIPKPDSNREITTSPDFRQELIRKLKGLGRGAKPWLAGRLRAETGSAAERAQARPGAMTAAFPCRPFSLAAAHHRHRQLDRRSTGPDRDA
ncbi:MAG: response regulator [Methyloceanibacter sp.]